VVEFSSSIHPATAKHPDNKEGLVAHRTAAAATARLPAQGDILLTYVGESLPPAMTSSCRQRLPDIVSCKMQARRVKATPHPTSIDSWMLPVLLLFGLGFCLNYNVATCFPIADNRLASESPVGRLLQGSKAAWQIYDCARRLVTMGVCHQTIDIPATGTIIKLPANTG